MDIDIDILRERLASSSINSSRESSMHSNASSVLYHKRMEIQSNNPLWSEQVENEENERLSLSYAIPTKKGDSLVKQATDNSSIERDQCDNNMASALKNMSAPIGESEAINNTNMCPPQEFENVPLLYDIYQPVKPNTWNGEALPISVHSSMKVLDIDAKNMTILLLHIIFIYLFFLILYFFSFDFFFFYLMMKRHVTAFT